MDHGTVVTVGALPGHLPMPPDKSRLSSNSFMNKRGQFRAVQASFNSRPTTETESGTLFLFLQRRRLSRVTQCPSISPSAAQRGAYHRVDSIAGSMADSQARRQGDATVRFEFSQYRGLPVQPRRSGRYSSRCFRTCNLGNAWYYTLSLTYTVRNMMVFC